MSKHFVRNLTKMPKAVQDFVESLVPPLMRGARLLERAEMRRTIVKHD